MLKKRIVGVGSLFVSLILLSLGSNVKEGQEAYFFPNLIAYFLVGFSLLLLITEGKLFSWIKELLSQLLNFIFSDSPDNTLAKNDKKDSRNLPYSSLYLSISKSVSAEEENLIVFKRLRDDFLALIPMLAVVFFYLNFAETIGLYTTSFIAFLLIVIIYTDSRPRSKSLVMHSIIGSSFIGFIYLVFAVLLQLQTPHALLL